MDLTLLAPSLVALLNAQPWLGPIIALGAIAFGVWWFKRKGKVMDATDAAELAHATTSAEVASKEAGTFARMQELIDELKDRAKAAEGRASELQTKLDAANAMALAKEREAMVATAKLEIAQEQLSSLLRQTKASVKQEIDTAFSELGGDSVPPRS